MALKLDKTDEKGVKTRYHAIQSFTYERGAITVRLYSYVNQATRDAEKTALEQNTKALEYERNLDRLRTELDLYVGVDDDESKAKAIELTNQVNELTLDPNRPKFTDILDTHYGSNEVVLPYFEPLTLESIYQKLSEVGVYSGAEAI